MSMQTDIYSISPTTNAAYYRAAAASAGSSALTLLQSNAGPNGVGYKVSITTVGDSSGRTFTIVGHAMGTETGTVTTEVVTGPNATTVYSTNYFDTITSITPSGATTGNLSIGVLGTSAAIKRCRIKSIYYVGTATAGSVKVNLNNASTGKLLVQVDTPASATVQNNLLFAGEGILVGGNSALTDIGIVTLTNVTFSTIMFG
jgi:hypothetical protein